jgi:chromate transporter
VSLVRPRLGDFFFAFLRIGNSTFGSGTMMVTLLAEEMRERRWLEQARIDLYFTLSRVLPGTNVMAFVASAAHAVRGWPGVALALMATSVPASAVTLVLTLAYQRWNTTPLGGAFLGGAMSAIVGVILAAAWRIALPGLASGARARTAALAIGAAALSFWLSPLLILALAATLGAIWPRPE